MVVGANLQLKDKLEAPQVGTSGPSQQRHSRRYYQNPTALHYMVCESFTLHRYIAIHKFDFLELSNILDEEKTIEFDH